MEGSRGASNDPEFSTAASLLLMYRFAARHLYEDENTFGTYRRYKPVPGSKGEAHDGFIILS